MDQSCQPPGRQLTTFGRGPWSVERDNWGICARMRAAAGTLSGHFGARFAHFDKFGRARARRSAAALTVNPAQKKAGHWARL